MRDEVRVRPVRDVTLSPGRIHEDGFPVVAIEFEFFDEGDPGLGIALPAETAIRVAKDMDELARLSIAEQS